MNIAARKTLQYARWLRPALLLVLLLCVVLSFGSEAAMAQSAGQSAGQGVDSSDVDSSGVLAELGDTLTNAARDGDAPISFDARIIQLLLLVTVLSLAPGIAMMITCLPFMIIVFSFLRQAIGLQQSPPNMMIVGLAMFLTFFVMEPVFTQSWEEGLSPYMDGLIDEDVAVDNTLGPFRDFMEARTDDETIARLAATMPERGYDLGEETAMPLLVTSFMLSEIKKAFQIGFAIFLPFLIIDLIVASILMAMGMMMVPPAVVALPFKLAFFVMADGWLKITEALLRGYGVA